MEKALPDKKNLLLEVDSILERTRSLRGLL